MRIIPVLDLQRGRAVHARGGEREHYQPVRSVLHEGSDPIALARAYRDRLGRSEIYIADLDAIAGAEPAFDIYQQLLELGLNLWLDAGVRRADDVARLINAGIANVVLALETLEGRIVLEEVVNRFDRDRVVFCLDLKNGVPAIAAGADWNSADPYAMVTSAIDAGVRRVIVLDIAHVGSEGGVGAGGIVGRLAKRHPDVEVFGGGGVRGTDDLYVLKLARAAGTLIASALHSGRIGRRHIERFERNAR
jgi:phosphoribosylformimino-5-aminoimidazole carboxamide ribotide isomerase